MACLLVIACLTSCGTYFNQPLVQEPSRIGEASKSTNILLNLPDASEKVEVAVYNFSDQTGQYKPVENGSTFSTAVTQGATTMLIKALEDSGWFIPIERENLSNLSTERNIIRNTKKEYIKGLNPNEPPLPPLLYAGLMLEGGIISYDTNIITGGMGARYFGVGASGRYRQDRITVYLRAVSTNNGEILKTVYVSKTILSQAVDVNLFRFVKFQRLLEAETGFTRNEPMQLVVKDAIEKAVHDLIVEGVKDGYWKSNRGPRYDENLVSKYADEQKDAANTMLYDRFLYKRRANDVIHTTLGGTLINGDYINPQLEFNSRLAYKRYFSSHFNFNLNFNKFNLANKDLLNEGFMSYDLNVEYTVLPFDRLSPFIFGGVGSNVSNYFIKLDPKIQAGLGLEYMATDKLGVSLYGEHNLVFSDMVDDLDYGVQDDMYYRFGLGLNIYLGKTNSRIDKKRALNRERRKNQRAIRRQNINNNLQKQKVEKLKKQGQTRTNNETK